MNYLIYIEHAAENLQFFLWFRSYTKRFDELPPSERVLAPLWTQEQAEADAQAPSAPKQKVSVEAAAVFKGTNFAPPVASVVEVKPNPFNTPPRTPNGDRASVVPSEHAWSDYGSTLHSSTNKSFQSKAAGAFEGADLKWQPCQHNIPVSMFVKTDNRCSYDPAIPRGSITHHCNLYSRWNTSSAKSFGQRAIEATTRSSEHHSSLSIC